MTDVTFSGKAEKQVNKGFDNMNTHGNRSLTPQNIGKHHDPVFGENFCWVSSTASLFLVFICVF